MGIRLKIFFLLFAFLVAFQADAQRKIQWRTWEEVEILNKTKKKKIFVDVYTKWCKYCKKMDRATFQKDHIAKYINDNYYAIKFNAEHKADITFNGVTYKYVKSGKRGYNELAVKLTRGKMNYPTIVFLDENQNILQPIPGFQGPLMFEKIITYFADNHFKSTPWNRYISTYDSKLLKGTPVNN